MDNKTASVTISNEPPEHPALDFAFLRQEGIRYIQRLAGNSWTDYNTHDPGVTILDQLCYAITDLSYRINYDIKDLIAEKDGNSYHSLYSPAEILTVNPVTILDLRKLVLDIEGVKNAWVEKQALAKPDIYFNPRDKSLALSKEDGANEILPVSGLYRVLIARKEDTQTDAQAVETEAKKRLQACRGLCEDFAEVKVLAPELITVTAQIEVGQVTDINLLAATVLYSIACHISPPIPFYTLDAQLKKGKRIDEIFEGPVLQRGFVEDEDLLKAGRKTELHTSDIIRRIMDVQGVLAVNTIKLFAGESAGAEDWFLQLDKEKTPQLDLRWKDDTIATDLTFTRNGFALRLDPVTLTAYYRSLSQASNFLPLDIKERDLIPPATTYRNISRYYSIQNHFQQVYGIGETGLADSAPQKRVAQAKQLKAYLLFFEQILADYFEQTARAKDLFSFYNRQGTYFHQTLRNRVPGAEEILAEAKAARNGVKKTAAESEAEKPERENRFLDHLLSRFSESFTDYSLLLFNQLTETTELKQLFLQNYPAVSNDRGKAFNYKQQSWNTENISGLEKRIAAKLGITNYTRRSLSGNSEEGFHLLEHLLLRPVPEDYSFFSRYLIPKDISGFEDAGNGFTKCFSEKHGLQSGNEVRITGSNGYDGTYKVDNVLPDNFQISQTYTGPGLQTTDSGGQTEGKPKWIRTDLNTKILILTKPVGSITQAADSNRSLCESTQHHLEEGEMIEIAGTKNYDGVCQVVKINSPDSFEIDKAFSEEEKETGGRWISTNQLIDPYSLQLTFVFPADRERFAMENFRSFAETTIREETPVHLTPFVRWMDKDELQLFENSFQSLLTQLLLNG